MNIKKLIKERVAENRKIKALRLKIRHEERIKTAKYSEKIRAEHQRAYIKKGKFWGTLHRDLSTPKNRKRTADNIRAMLFGGRK